MKNEIITIETESKIYRFKYNELYSVTVNSGIVAHTLENKEVIYKINSLKETLKNLPGFIRINNNCAVSSLHIREFCKQTRTVTLTNKDKYKVSVRRVKAINEITLN